MSQNKPLCIDLFCGLTLSRVPAASRYRDPAACDRWDTTPRTCAVECSPSSAMPRFFGILACEQPPEPSFRGRTRTLSGVSDTSFGAVPSLHPAPLVSTCALAHLAGVRRRAQGSRDVGLGPVCPVFARTALAPSRNVLSEISWRQITHRVN